MDSCSESTVPRTGRLVLHPVPHWEVLSGKYQVSWVTLFMTPGPQDTVLTEPVARGSDPCL